jgi:hypothetical protein
LAIEDHHREALVSLADAGAWPFNEGEELAHPRQSSSTFSELEKLGLCICRRIGDDVCYWALTPKGMHSFSASYTLADPAPAIQPRDVPLCDQTPFELYMQLVDNNWVLSRRTKKMALPAPYTGGSELTLWLGVDAKTLQASYLRALTSAESILVAADGKVQAIYHFQSDRYYKQLLDGKAPAAVTQGVRAAIEDDGGELLAIEDDMLAIEDGGNGNDDDDEHDPHGDETDDKGSDDNGSDGRSCGGGDEGGRYEGGGYDGDRTPPAPGHEGGGHDNEETPPAPGLGSGPLTPIDGGGAATPDVMSDGAVEPKGDGANSSSSSSTSSSSSSSSSSDKEGGHCGGDDEEEGGAEAEDDEEEKLAEDGEEEYDEADDGNCDDDGFAGDDEASKPSPPAPVFPLAKKRKAEIGKRWGPFKIAPIERCGKHIGWGASCGMHENSGDGEFDKCKKSITMGKAKELTSRECHYRMKQWCLLGHLLCHTPGAVEDGQYRSHHIHRINARTFELWPEAEIEDLKPETPESASQGDESPFDLDAFDIL